MPYQNNPDACHAKRLLTHYIRTLTIASGGQWDNDNDVEVEEIVDRIIDAATAEAEPQPMSRADYVQLHADTIGRLP